MSNNGTRLLKEAPFKISSPFGYRVNPVTKQSEGHNGVDYATFGKKVPCYPPVSGKVLRVGKDRFGANFLYVGFSGLSKVGLYYHLDSISVILNQPVTPDTQLGLVGTTGQSTGIHLHFSWIDWNENALNYNLASYSDFEKYIFEEADEEVNISDVKMIVNNQVTTKKAIIQNGENYVRIRDLEDLIIVSYDNEKKMPVLKKK